MNSEQILSLIGMILFGLAFYPLFSLVLEEKDERQSQYFMNAIKIPAILSIFIFGAIFIFYLLNGIYSLPIVLAIYLLDLNMYFVILLYKLQLNPDGKFQNLASKLEHDRNIKKFTVLRNVSIILTAVFLALNYKTFFIPYSYRITFLLCAYIFFVLSCYFGKKVSHFKISARQKM